jgi:Ras-related GTP-binding protein C/D
MLSCHLCCRFASERDRGSWRFWYELVFLTFSCPTLCLQGDYFEALERLNDVILSAYSYNPLIHFHVFVHKADGHSNDYRYGESYIDLSHQTLVKAKLTTEIAFLFATDTLQDIQSRVADNLSDSNQSFIFAPTAHEILAEAAAAQDSLLELQLETGQESAETGHSSFFRSASAMQSNFTTAGLPSEIGPDLERDVRLSFHVTSILNCSINIAWSRVQIDLMNVEVSRTLESICNGLCYVSERCQRDAPL